MRVQTVFQRLLDLQGIRVTAVEMVVGALAIIVDVALRRRRMVCSRCGRSCTTFYDSKLRTWRHLDFGPWAIHIRFRRRRVDCPRCKAVVSEAVPWAEVGSAFTRDFEDVTSFLTQQANKTAVARLMKVSWSTVGNIVQRTVAQHRLPLRMRRLYRIGIDEISYRRHHKYLTLVADHDTGEVVWGGKGRSGATLDGFLDELGEEGRASIELVSMDMAEAFVEKVRERLPNATIVFDPFHVVRLANTAVDEVRRDQVRQLKGTGQWHGVKKTRWLLLKDPDNLSVEETMRLSSLAKVNKRLYRAYLLKEALRELYAQPAHRAAEYLDRWLAWASRSRLPPFVKLARTIRSHKAGVLAAVVFGLSNGRLEGLNTKVRLLSHRAFGFHSADALLALVYLCCSGIKLRLPSDRRYPHAR
jgi:transposase